MLETILAQIIEWIGPMEIINIILGVVAMVLGAKYRKVCKLINEAADLLRAIGDAGLRDEREEKDEKIRNIIREYNEMMAAVKQLLVKETINK